MVKNPPANGGNRGFLGREGSLEKEMATHPSLLAWKIPWTEEPGGLQSTGSQESEVTYQLNHHHYQYIELAKERCTYHLMTSPHDVISFHI